IFDDTFSLSARETTSGPHRRQTRTRRMTLPQTGRQLRDQRSHIEAVRPPFEADLPVKAVADRLQFRISKKEAIHSVEFASIAQHIGRDNHIQSIARATPRPFAGYAPSHQCHLSSKHIARERTSVTTLLQVLHGRQIEHQHICRYAIETEVAWRLPR